MFFRLFVLVKADARMGIMFFWFFMEWFSKIDCQCSSTLRILPLNLFSELKVSIRSAFSTSLSFISESYSASGVGSTLGRIGGALILIPLDDL